MTRYRGASLRLIHSLCRNTTAKPPWAMRAEAVWWLLHGSRPLARRFWTDARNELNT